MNIAALRQYATILATLALSALPAGCSQQSQDSGLRATDNKLINFSDIAAGTWAKMLVLSSNSSALGISSKNRIARYVLLELTKSDHQLQAQEKTCDIATVSSGGSSLTIPQAFKSSVVGNSYTYAFTQKDNATTLTMTDAVEVLGANIDDKLHSPLPTSADDRQVIDQDGDGNPGVTVDVAAKALFPIKGRVYLVQRTIWSEQARIFDATKITGLATWIPEQKILGSSNALLTTVVPSVTAIPSESIFVMVKLSDGSSCDSLLNQRNQLFPLLKI